MKTNRNKNLIGSVPLFMILCFFLIVSCQETVPTELLEEAFKVHGRDNGNQGDASDIEINYNQYGLDDIKGYRAFVVKSQKASTHDLDFLQSLEESKYIDLAVNEVIPSRGKRLPASFLDSDGDIIQVDLPYKIAVISLPKDPSTFLPVLAYSDEDIVLSRNHLVTDFTDRLELGGGQLAINSEETLVLASYDVINDLNTAFPEQSKFLTIDNMGEVNSDEEIFPHLGGVSADSKGNFFVTNTRNSEIIRYTNNGEKTILQLQGEQLVEPTGIYIDPSDVLYVADRNSGSIYRLNSDGLLTRYATPGEGVLGLTGDEEGNLYASINVKEGKIVKILPGGQVRSLAEIPTYVKDNYLLPFISWLGHLTYHEGILYVAGTSTNQIYNVSMDGEVSVFAGTGDRLLPYGDILSADFNRPIGLAFSPDGQILYVSGCEDTTPQHTQASSPSRVYKIELVE